MGVEMHVLAPYTFYGEVFKNKHELEEAIKNTQEGLDESKAALYKLIYMTEPKKFVPDDYEGEPEEWLDKRIKAIIHDMRVANVDLYKYGVLLEYWDKFHKGSETITIPKEMRDKHPIFEYAFGEGDWLDLVYPDGTPVAEEDY
jgi:hypothetical protein